MQKKTTFNEQAWRKERLCKGCKVWMFRLSYNLDFDSNMLETTNYLNTMKLSFWWIKKVIYI